MQLDPAVNRRKFRRELSRLLKQRETLESRGVFVLKDTAFPFVNVTFVPRNPMQILVPAEQPGALVVVPGPMKFIVGQFESIAARAFKARFDLSDYDLRAPSITFLDPWTDEILKYPNMFRGFEFEKDRKSHLVILDDHPNTHRPFLCLRGVREYHEHPQHSGDEWLLYRDEVNMFSIVMSLWRVAVDLARPRLAPGPAGPQMLWIGEEKL